MFAEEFRPHPLFSNGHIQTIAGSYWRDGLKSLSTVRHTLSLSDGDQLILHEDPPDEPVRSNLIMLMAHGLGGSNGSGYVRRTAFKLNRRGVRTVRLDLRGHGAGATLAKQPAHAGRSEDIAAAIEWIAHHHPDKKILVAGFSLSANMVLKLAGEWGEHPHDKVVRMLAVAPPIDLAQCCNSLSVGWNKIYDGVFVRAVLMQVRRLMQAGIVSGKLPHPLPQTIREFDTIYTSIRSGFRDVEDYYERASSAALLHRIQVPTTIVAAEDDPIIPASIFSKLQLSAVTKLVMTRHGGHLGYLGRRGSDPDRRWLDWRIVEWALHGDNESQLVGVGAGGIFS